jgi:4-amino-4-deoxy-L-arabinose transferase-like glycosyltransferase
MRGREPVDWDKELLKTKKIQRRGLGISALSLLFALAMIGGVKFYRPEASVSKVLLPAIAMFFAVGIIFLVLMKRWKR